MHEKTLKIQEVFFEPAKVSRRTAALNTGKIRNSELIPQHHLHIARAVVQSRDLSELRVYAIAGDAGVDQRQVRHAELDPVEQVVHLGAELELVTALFPEQPRVLHESHIEIILAGSRNVFWPSDPIGPMPDSSG